MSYSESTTWTIGRILDRLHETGEEVVVYAGHHAHRGVIRAVGEFVLTLQAGGDVVAVTLSSVSSVQLLGASLTLPERVLDLEDEPEDPQPRAEGTRYAQNLFADPVTVVDATDEPLGPDPVTDPVTVTAPARDDEVIAAEAARRTEELRDWLRQLREPTAE